MKKRNVGECKGDHWAGAEKEQHGTRTGEWEQGPWRCGKGKRGRQGTEKGEHGTWNRGWGRGTRDVDREKEPRAVDGGRGTGDQGTWGVICNRGRKFAWPVQNKLLTGSVLFKPGTIPQKKSQIRNLPRV